MAAFDVERFILEVKRRPVLWDPTHSEYNHRQAKVSAWEEVASNSYPDSGEWSNYDKFGKVRDIQKRWKTMRDSFIRELKYERKVAEGLALAKKRKYIYSHLLEFLSPKQKTSTPGEKQSSSDESSSNEETEGETESEISRTNTSDCHVGMDEGYSSSHIAQFCKTTLGPQTPQDHPPEQYSCLSIAEQVSSVGNCENSEKQHRYSSNELSTTISTPLPCFTPHPFPRNPSTHSSSMPPLSFNTPVLNTFSTPLSHSSALEQDDDKMFLLSLLPYFKKLSEERKLEARINVTRVLQDMLYKPS